MVKKWTPGQLGGMKEADYGEWVSEEDCDALTARLAEAEAILRAVYDEANSGTDVWSGSYLMRHVERFLGLPEMYNDTPAAPTTEALVLRPLGDVDPAR